MEQNKSIDLLIYEFKQKMTDTINESILPLTIKAMVLRELTEATASIAEQQILQEVQAKNNKNNQLDKDETKAED